MIPERVTWPWLKSLASQTYRALKRLIKAKPWLSLPLAAISCALLHLMLLQQAMVWGAWGPLPAVEELRPIGVPSASQVYSIDGQVLGLYYLEERLPVSLEEVSPHLVKALIATEDVRFYEHQGVDWWSMGRAFIKGFLLQEEAAGGGSTLTMQLAKNLYPRQDFGWFTLPLNKLREMILAQRLEKALGKNEILIAYLNTVAFGENAFGIESAARRYFGHPAQQLSPTEAALLVGLLKGTTYYNPRQHPDRALGRRNVVLEQMHKDLVFSRWTADSLKRLPLNLNFSQKNHHDGPAPYFLAYLRQQVESLLAEVPHPEGRAWNVYTDGLRLITPIHSRMQAYANEALQTQMKRVQENFDKDWQGINPHRAFKKTLQRQIRKSQLYLSLKRAGKDQIYIDSMMQVPKPVQVFTWEGPQIREMSTLDSVLYSEMMLQAGFMAMDPRSGHIRAWVGGIDHHFYQYDHVTSRRQTGSVFKPFVYATALENGMAPCEYIPNDQVVFQEYGDWSPKNSDHSYGGEYSMRGALTQSVNVVAVNLLMEVGADKVVDLGQKLGLNPDIPAVPSIALGAAEASLYEMLGAYASFFNGGQAIRPQPLLRIEDAQGRILLDLGQNLGMGAVLRPETAQMMTHMMRNVVERGTARRLRSRYGLKHHIAGKTGTTQSQTDGWFLGSTPDLLAGAWVGANDQGIHFRTLARGQGAATALPIWGDFMRRLSKDEEFAGLTQSKFPVPSSQLRKAMDCDDLAFPLAMSEFKAWWQEKKRLDSIKLARGARIP